MQPSRTLFLILLLGFVLRYAGISFGLPHLYHADEPIVVNHALAFGTGDLNPHFFKIPPLVSYLLFIVYGFAFVAGKLTGIFPSVRDFEFLFLSDPSIFYVTGRFFFGTLLGTLSIWLFYRFARRFTDTGTSLLASFFFSIAYLHVRDSHYIYADIPLIAVILAAFPAFLNFYDERSVSNAVKAGAWIGLAAAVKYNGFFLVVPWIFCLLAARTQIVQGLLASAISIVGVFILLNPYSVLDFQTFRAELLQQSQSQTGVPWLHHLSYSLLNGVGAFALIAAFLKPVFYFQNGGIARKMTGLFCISYYIILCLKGQPYERYVLILVPFIMLAAADAIAFLFRSGRFFPKFIGISLAAGITAYNLTSAVLWDRLMLKPDTRTVAKSWIEANLPAQASIALGWDFFMPRLAFSNDQLEQKKAEVNARAGDFKNSEIRRLDHLLSTEKQGYRLSFLSRQPEQTRFLLASPAVPFDYPQLKTAGVEYIILPILRVPQEPESFRQELQQNAELIKTWTPYRVSRMLPIERIPLTGGPFLWQELTARERNGAALALYKLR